MSKYIYLIYASHSKRVLRKLQSEYICQIVRFIGEFEIMK